MAYMKKYLIISLLLLMGMYISPEKAEATSPICVDSVFNRGRLNSYFEKEPSRYGRTQIITGDVLEYEEILKRRAHGSRSRLWKGQLC